MYVWYDIDIVLNYYNCCLRLFVNNVNLVV